jgi:long-subunit acyl-CoA synthetase (AMP-forming)
MQALSAQIRALVEAWDWSADDRILSVLPLHHVHGIVAVQVRCKNRGRIARPAVGANIFVF